GSGVVLGDYVTLTASNGLFNNKTVAMAKPVSADLALTGGDAGNYTVNATAATTATITAIALTGSITADSRPYDGTAVATVHASLGSGVVLGDYVTLTATNGLFNNKTVAMAKPVSADLALTGGDAGNRTANATAATTATITAIALTGSITADSRPYNGTAVAAVHASLGSGVVLGDYVTVTASNGLFNNKTVGMAKPVSAD